jgi:hypothetical protein
MSARSRSATDTSNGGAMRIVVEPTATELKWVARLGNRVLCTAAGPRAKGAGPPC